MLPYFLSTKLASTKLSYLSCYHFFSRYFILPRPLNFTLPPKSPGSSSLPSPPCPLNPSLSSSRSQYPALRKPLSCPSCRPLYLAFVASASRLPLPSSLPLFSLLRLLDRLFVCLLRKCGLRLCLECEREGGRLRLRRFRGGEGERA